MSHSIHNENTNKGQGKKKKEERGKKDINSTPFADAKVSFTIGKELE